MANEKRLIDANSMREDWLENGENAFVYDTNAVLDSIDAQPTVDAIPMPCKMGDEVWGLRKTRYSLSPEKGIVHHMYFGDDMRLCICVKNVCRGEWGNNVFATKEEAEEALAKMDGGDGNG